MVVRAMTTKSTFFLETSRPRARFFGEIVPSGVMWGKGSKKASEERGGFLDQ